MNGAQRRFLPSIASLRALEALDRLGSATAAAEELNQTQSAVSRQLQALEAQLGTSLIIRERKTMRLTPAAKEYAATIRGALQTIAQASLKVQVNPRGGSLNLAILPTFGMRWLVPRLPDFAARHPEITINMATRLKPFDFAFEPFDAAIHFGNAEWPGTSHLKLRPENMLPVCAPQVLNNVTVAHPRDLLDLPLLHIETRPTAWSQWFDSYGVSPGTVSGTIFDQFSTILQAAIHGLGVALMPDYLVQQDLKNGNLVVAYGGATRPLGAYYLVWPTERSEDRSLKIFRTWLATQAEDEDPLPR
ncbi:Gcv operon activator [Thalassovita gelatinovora]|uniref:Gcv operon activator n=1 Tax=Thalassovita gelatinovora TaxID=53501 RepID=A0A0P1F555_THAGE|nr:LysR substrate-binding domain-containing protein [Thalassovita gelatinovora]QIZ79469.1 LysR family transcriptional regulator [Thalassovita gelatinovora]CUH62840.1 Gcv operon activator [Thalassovita gelatinovora]SEQ11376.1 transcriptional regulator, LysR family [Thalassovita gelatinovora]